MVLLIYWKHQVVCPQVADGDDGLEVDMRVAVNMLMRHVQEFYILRDRFYSMGFIHWT
jgi:hypothetical protein